MALDTEITVGIVDNDKFVLPSLRTSIGELMPEARVVWVTMDGGEAVSNCLNAATRPRVLLADMSMEGVSGISVCRRIRTRISKVGILAMTAYSLDKYSEKASLAGMSIKDIASTLNITPETVKKHGQRAMHKLGANSRWQAVAMWLNAEA